MCLGFIITVSITFGLAMLIKWIWSDNCTCCDCRHHNLIYPLGTFDSYEPYCMQKDLRITHENLTRAEGENRRLRQMYEGYPPNMDDHIVRLVRYEVSKEVDERLNKKKGK